MIVTIIDTGQSGRQALDRQRQLFPAPVDLVIPVCSRTHRTDHTAGSRRRAAEPGGGTTTSFRPVSRADYASDLAFASDVEAVIFGKVRGDGLDFVRVDAADLGIPVSGTGIRVVEEE